MYTCSKKLVLLASIVVLFGSISGCLLRHTGTDDPADDNNPLVTITYDDLDGDGVLNIDDSDIDGDGIPNEQDHDIDGDGIANTQDSDLDDDEIPNSEDSDIDGDGIPNTQDPDIDNDGIPNNQDSVPGSTGNQVSGTEGTVNTGTDINTDGTGNVTGISVVAVDTVAYTLDISASQTAGSTISTEEKIDLNKVRDKIEENSIELSTVDFTDLSIVASGSEAFIQANNDTRIVVTVSYRDENNNKIKVLESAAADRPAQVLTIGDLAAGIQLNDEIFAASGGYSTFTNMVKDKSKSSVFTVIDIKFLDATSQGGTDLDLNFILQAAGLQPM